MKAVARFLLTMYVAWAAISALSIVVFFLGVRR